MGGGGGGVRAREGRRKTRMRLMIYTLATVYYCLEPVRGYHLLVSFFLFFFSSSSFSSSSSSSSSSSLRALFASHFLRSGSRTCDLPYFSRNDVESRIFGREKNSTRVWLFFFRVKIAPLAGERKRKYTRPFFLKMHGAEKYVGFGYETLCIEPRRRYREDRSPRIMIEIKVKKRKEKKRERRKVSLGSRGYRVAYLH